MDGIDDDVDNNQVTQEDIKTSGDDILRPYLLETNYNKWSANKFFRDELEEILKETECSAINVYNAMKCNLQEMSQLDPVSLILCTNSDGSIKCTAMVIGSCKHPPSFKNITIPVHYAYHEHGYPDNLLYQEWFSDVFLSNVRKQRWETRKTEKIVVLVDVEPTLEMFKLAEVSDVRVVQARVGAFVEPLNQGILSKFEQSYRECFLIEMVIKNGELGCGTKMESCTMKDCCFAIANAWDSMSKEEFQIAWKKLLDEAVVMERSNEIAFHSCGVIRDLGRL